METVRTLPVLSAGPGKALGIQVPGTQYWISDSGLSSRGRKSWLPSRQIAKTTEIERSALISYIDHILEVSAVMIRFSTFRRVNLSSLNKNKCYFNALSKALKKWRADVIQNGRVQKLRKKVAARTIQRAFRRAIGNPAYQMCKNRLLREFQELS